MVKVGYIMSSEEHGPNELVRHAAAAEDAGFTTAWISDHYHPWVHPQGHSPFVWSVLGGIAHATETLRVGTGVTCPTIRIHPAVIAQAAATTAVMLPGRFFLGVGSGENLNEHILGDRWPPAPVRLEMLEEAVAVMRLLWQGGQQTHYGTHYTVENARIYDLPEDPIPVYVSAFGPKALEVAARIGDGYVGTSPEPDLVEAFRSKAGDDKPRIGEMKCCWGDDEAACRTLAHKLWPNIGLPGQLAQDLATPALFEQATQLVTEDMVAGPIPCGDDPEQYATSIRQYADAGYDEVFIHNIGEDQTGFVAFFRDEVRPLLD
ncbi:MAG TPA: TIGR03557 family F420-dependent LLM class oxidoreductase [Egibacteraceae bacterium]|nr:TIGR03557 family F420-dependent LLM class oxidoreductase [Egibacteraceae bacterium]